MTGWDWFTIIYWGSTLTLIAGQWVRLQHAGQPDSDQ